jgi:nucleotide-binding universal stress UspA family protein
MKFLVAVDGSEASGAALSFALELAGATGASVTVVHAVDPDIYRGRRATAVRNRDEGERRDVLQRIDDTESRGEEILDDAAATAASRGTSVETTLLFGDPVEEIPAFADDGSYDTLFLGHRPVPEQYERVLGSVAKTIIERTGVPVTVVQ